MAAPSNRCLSDEVKNVLKYNGGAYLVIGISKIVPAPLERVKLIFQTQHELVRINRLHRPLGLYDIYSQAVAREGLSSLWRGTTTSFLRHFTNQAVSSFVVRGPIRNKVLTYPFQHPNGLLAWTLRTLTLGWVPVLFTMVAMTPFDVIHTRLVCDLADASVDGRSKGWRKYESAWDVVQQTLKNEGISGLFNGCTSYVLGIPFYRFLYFALHDAAANIQLHPDMIKTKLLLNLGVTIAAGWLSYPFACAALECGVGGGREVGTDGASGGRWTLAPHHLSSSLLEVGSSALIYRRPIINCQAQSDEKTAYVDTRMRR